MEKYIYNDSESFKGMDIENSFEGNIDDNINISTELEYFQLFFDNKIMKLLCDESNEYITDKLKKKYGENFKHKILEEKAYNTYRYLYVTKGINEDDILAFIGVRLFMGIHKYSCIDKYWSRDILYCCIAGEIMSKEYYYLIAYSLHFPQKSNINNLSDVISNNSDESDPRKKINLFLELLCVNFRKYYTLGNNITIDESLLHFTGRNKMKFYIPMKPYKWGFKIHLLCDSNTNYLWDCFFDPGKDSKDFVYFEDNPSVTESIVLRLISKITDNKERNIFFDGWYSSISLLNKLTEKGYRNTTVIRGNAKDLPSKIKKDGYENAYKNNILIQKFHDKKDILFLSNYKISVDKLKNLYIIFKGIKLQFLVSKDLTLKFCQFNKIKIYKNSFFNLLVNKPFWRLNLV